MSRHKQTARLWKLQAVNDMTERDYVHHILRFHWTRFWPKEDHDAFHSRHPRWRHHTHRTAKQKVEV